jgi:hypothetical protein
MDMIIKMHFILCMLGVPVDGPALLLGDNNSVVLNTSVPSILKKKHHACAYHQVQEAIAGGIMNFIHIKGTMNYADMLSKPLSNVQLPLGDQLHSITVRTIYSHPTN